MSWMTDIYCNNIIFLAYLISLAGLFLFCLRNTYKMVYIFKHGDTASATITYIKAFWTPDDSTTRGYNIEYAFAVNGKSYRGKVNVGGKVYDKIPNDNYLDVLYNPNWSVSYPKVLIRRQMYIAFIITISVAAALIYATFIRLGLVPFTCGAQA